MKSLSPAVTIVILTVCRFSTAQAKVIHVPGDSTTIRSGLRGAGSGDTVLVAPGTYYENIIWPAVNGIKLLSEAGAEATIIDGLNLTQVLWLGSGQDTSTLIEGFTIQNGYNINYAGGIQCFDSSPTIRRNTIAKNFGGRGGGVMCFRSQAVIDGNTIETNAALYWGGGISCPGATSLLIINNEFQDNSAEFGGGISCLFSSAVIEGNSIIRNSAQYWGGAIYCDSSQVTIRDNLMTENSAGWFGGGIYGQSYSILTINNNEIFSNINYGAYNEDTTITIDATYNWWGHDTGPYDPSTGPPDYNPGGQGDMVSDYVAYRPWLSGPGLGEEPVAPGNSPRLFQNRPNPCREFTIINYQLPDQMETTLQIYDPAGRLIRSLVDEIKEAGCYQATWDGKDDEGRRVPAGVYFCTLTTGGLSETRKLIALQ